MTCPWDLQISGSHLLMCVAQALLHEHAVVEIALVPLPHVDKTENVDTCHMNRALSFLALNSSSRRGDEHDAERAQRVGGEDGLAHLDEFDFSGARYSAGICASDWFSVEDMKSRRTVWGAR
jgi:hypothetical protein